MSIGLVYHKLSDANMSAIIESMALFVRQDDNRSELQQRVAKELQEKARQRAEHTDTRPDGIEDSNYLENTKTTTSLAWVWILIVLLAVGVFAYLVTKFNGV